MNTLKKIYCRTYQGAFKAAIPALPYRTPQVLSKINDVPALFREKGIRRLLLVTDAFVGSCSFTLSLLAALQKAEISVFVYEKTVSNPTVENVEEARALYLANRCEGLCAIGGGSSIDCAKGVGARLARPKRPIPKMEGILKVGRATPYTVAIPTTAGTGSETTVTTVITDGKTHHKFPISDFSLIPNAAVLDPQTTETLPQHITATTGMDALTHAVEAFIGRSTVKATRKAAIEAVQLIFENLEKACAASADETVRKNMLRAAFLAGSAFSKSYVGYCHAVAHSLGGKYNIPHGLANAVLLPYVLDAYGSTAHRKLAQLAVCTGLANADTLPAEAAGRFIRKIRDLNSRLGIPEKLPGIQTADIPALARYAAREANPLYPVPKLMDAEALQQFYIDVMEAEK